MLTEKFDPYGEASPDAGRGYPGKTGSAFLSRAGQYLFWLLVVIIVSARIIYYPVTPRFEVGSAGEAKHAVTR